MGALYQCFLPSSSTTSSTGIHVHLVYPNADDNWCRDKKRKRSVAISTGEITGKDQIVG